jgi:hypothetical protein
MDKPSEDGEQSRGKSLTTSLLRYLFKLPPQIAWTTDIGDRLALGGMPEDLVRRLQRFCDANPLSAQSYIDYSIDLYDAGFARGGEEQ